MDSREGLIALRDRVGKLTGPDREVDCLVVVALDLRPGWLAKAKGHLWLDRGGFRPVVRLNELGARNGPGNLPLADDDVPRFTDSVDAVLSLIGKVLPGWWGDLDIGAKPDPFGARLWPPGEDGTWNIAGNGATPALALLHALLSALPPGDTSNG